MDIEERLNLCTEGNQVVYALLNQGTFNPCPVQHEAVAVGLVDGTRQDRLGGSSLKSIFLKRCHNMTWARNGRFRFVTYADERAADYT